MSVAAVEHHSGPWTVEDVLALPENSSNRIELVGGALLMSPNPGVPHQRTSFKLHVLLAAAVEAASAPFEVLEAVNVIVPDGLLIPDLVVADATAADKAGTTLSAHDIIVAVEIASPSTRVSDKRLKPSLYAPPESRTTGDSSSTPPRACTSATWSAAPTSTAWFRSARPPP